MSKQQLEHASALLERWSEALRRSRGVVEVQRTDVDLVELVKTVVAGMRLREPRAQSLDLQLDVPQLRGRWDRAQVTQVVENLLTNALKFGRERPVTITLTAVPSGAELRVKDQGIGIDRADQERIFQRLVRAVPAAPVLRPGPGAVAGQGDRRVPMAAASPSPANADAGLGVRRLVAPHEGGVRQ